jgi:hypothetical protein
MLRRCGPVDKRFSAPAGIQGQERRGSRQRRTGRHRRAVYVALSRRPHTCRILERSIFIRELLPQDRPPNQSSRARRCQAGSDAPAIPADQRSASHPLRPDGRDAGQPVRGRVSTRTSRRSTRSRYVRRAAGQESSAGSWMAPAAPQTFTLTTGKDGGRRPSARYAGGRLCPCGCAQSPVVSGIL